MAVTKIEHPSAEERKTQGKTTREKTPASSHSGWKPATDRPDPVALLEEQAATRVPELVPIRYGRMLVSPGTFYRGSALIMASDLAATPRSQFIVVNTRAHGNCAKWQRIPQIRRNIISGNNSRSNLKTIWRENVT